MPPTTSKGSKVFEDTTAQPAKTLINFIKYEYGPSILRDAGRLFNQSTQAALCEKRIGSRPSNVRVPR